MNQLNSLHDLFEKELKDAYSGELQMIDALPKMQAAATSDEVKSNLELHLRQTRDQASRLEEVFEMLDIDPSVDTCQGMAGIIADGERMIAMQGDSRVKDIAIMAVAQKIEHYEIATYGTLKSFARTLNEDKIADKLEKTLREESQTDDLLTAMTTGTINLQQPRSHI